MQVYRIKHKNETSWARLDPSSIGGTMVVLNSDMKPTGAKYKQGSADIEVLPAGCPQNFLALWNNSRVAIEHLKRQTPSEPLYFMKPASCLSGHEAKVAHPQNGHTMILEAELGIVIGKTASNVPVDKVADVILGYTCINDFTARNVVGKDKTYPQYTRAKGFDGFGGCGPFVETTRPSGEARIRGFINGRMVQDYPVKDLVFQPEELVSFMSHQMTLQPGDVIACGTSLGAEPLVAGDVVDVSVDGIGLLRSHII